VGKDFFVGLHWGQSEKGDHQGREQEVHCAMVLEGRK
jgi:hypothetical protein